MSNKETRKGRLYGEKTEEKGHNRQLWPIFTVRRGRHNKR